MKWLTLIVFITLLCNVSFSQTDTTAIFHIADSLIELGKSRLAEENTSEAYNLYNQAAEMTLSIDNSYNIHYANALNKMGFLYLYMGDNKNALKYIIDALDITEKTLGKEHLKYVSALNNISNIYSEMGEYSNALKYGLQAVELRKKIQGEQHLDYVASLNNVGNAYYDMGEYENALKYYLQAIDIREIIHGKEHPSYAASLNNIGIVYGDMGDYTNELKYKKQAMEIYKKVLGEEHIDYASSLNSMGNAYSNIDDYQNALKYYLQAIEIYEKAIGKETDDYAMLLNNIGVVYSDIGDYRNALKYYMQNLEIIKKIFGKEHPDYVSALNNIGVVYSDMGDFQNALEYKLQALEIAKIIHGEEHPVYAVYLNNVGIAYSNIGDNQTALKYKIQALDLRKKLLGEQHPDYATSLNNVGSTYFAMGDYQESLKYITQALVIRKKVLGEEHSYYAASLNNLAILYSQMGDYDNALKYHDEALKIKEKTLGADHPYIVSSLNNIGAVYHKMGKNTDAVIINKQATDLSKLNLIRNFSFMTAHEREAYWDANNEYFLNNIKYMSLVPDDTLSTKTSYDTELLTKGLLLASEISVTNTIMDSGDTALISEYEKMRLLHLLLNKEQEKSIAERVYNCDSIENEIQKAERHIMEKCKEFGDITEFIKIDWKDVQSSLKNNDVAIEFSNFTENDTTKYVALVLAKGMEAPVCVPLFNNYEMQKLQRGVVPVKAETPNDDGNRGAISVSGKRQGLYESTGLYNLIWKPLEKYFPENPRIYFAPSGMLHQIAVEYAPVDSDKTISDKYEIYRVSSTRFLAMDYMPRQMKNTVLYGGIYYDSDTAIMKQESIRYSTRSATDAAYVEVSRIGDRGGLNYLPGTKTEVENIVGTIKKKKKVKVTLYEGSQANEESFKALSGKDISVLHIATHGFYLPADEKMSGNQSLLQSGLLLSGANYAWQNKPLPEGVEDGILTAKEISFMDLRKTDFVVLSACQTALGEITGEGVFGLQRGFKKAGVRTIIMSLWPVDDNATLLMMTEFYSNLTKGMTKRDAFLAAQNRVKSTPGFENPRYWAAFIMLDGNE